MSKRIKDSEIEDFWDWFEEKEEAFRVLLYRGTEAEQKQLKNDFDEKVLSFGHFTWELNTGKEKSYEFVISPNREFELLQISKKIMAEAPDLEHWKFGYAKQKVKSIEPFKIYDESLDPHLINTGSWLFKSQGSTYKIYAPSLPKMDSETEEHVLDLVATAALGEEYRILNITKIERVKETDEGFSAF
ncbi:MAG: hypothetical protein ACI9IP_002462 [Arcticibacterium sp.]|jgi:hypothetical protein